MTHIVNDVQNGKKQCIALYILRDTLFLTPVSLLFVVFLIHSAGRSVTSCR